MKREELRMGMLVKSKYSEIIYGAIVIIKEHIDGNIYVDIMRGNGYDRDVNINDIEPMNRTKQKAKSI